MAKGSAEGEESERLKVGEVELERAALWSPEYATVYKQQLKNTNRGQKQSCS